MKNLLISVLLLSASFGVASPDPHAEMGCEIYQTRRENGSLKESALIHSFKTESFELGMAQEKKGVLPKPFEDVAVHFNHYRTSHNETNTNELLPYIQAYFSHQGKNHGLTFVNFDIVQ